MAEESANKFYVTTPIYYVNARPHIGHAYTTIVADVLARRHRLLGDDTFFLTGTDEHGQKIERSAAAAGIAPQQFADQVSAEFEGLWKRMGITNDQFIRTTDEAHKRGVQKLFTELYDLGHIYLSTYTGSYCVSDEAFVDLTVGTPCPDCGRPLELVTEENFFFQLSKFQESLIDLIVRDDFRITPDSAKNEVLSFLRGDLMGLLREQQLEDWVQAVGRFDLQEVYKKAEEIGLLKRSSSGTVYRPGVLRDLSISRSSFTWGIPVPKDTQEKAGTTQNHVVYVWLDALANYITAIGYGSEDPGDKAKFKEFWPADLHLVGKEITRFHCVYWPAFLLALNPSLRHKPNEYMPQLSPDEHRAWAANWLPKQVSAHGWLLFDNSKMSKSRGNIIRTETILDAFGTLCPAPPHATDLLSFRSEAEESASALSPSPHDRDLFAADVLRYFLLREIPFGQDGSFTFDALITRYNADLANGYGNLVSRTLSMIEKYFGGIVPDGYGTQHVGLRSFVSSEEVLTQNLAAFSSEIEKNRFNLALEFLSETISGIDRFINSEAPWKLAKESDSSRLAAVLLGTAENIRIITALLYPFLPYATANAWRQLGLGDIEQAAEKGELKNLTWGGLKPGTKLGPLSPVFPRADKGLDQIMIDMETQKNQQKHDPNQPLGANDAADAATPTASEFPEAAIASQGNTAHPAAPPRTGDLAEVNPGAQVGGSNATKPERAETPSHADAPASGIFAAQNAPAEGAAQIAIDDFAKVELRVAKVIVCERIPKADKLLRLVVDLGDEQRQILSGIAEWYTPEDLLGRRIVVITNLAPRKMRGLESHGMLLAASAPEGGKPALATFNDSDELPLGSRLK